MSLPIRLTGLLVLSFACLLQAQTLYQRARVQLSPERTIEQLAALGLETDHGKYRPGRYLENAFSEAEIALVREAGFSVEILIEDLHAHHRHGHAPVAASSRSNCDDDTPIYDYPDPQNWHQGSMGGFFTYQEMLDEFAEMAAQYPELIAPLDTVPNIATHDGYPIYWTRMSNNPLTDDPDKPEILYTALHHAREPASLAQMIFFLWYALERYDSDPEIAFLLDNTELYFMPCLNPDGYLYNEQTDPNGGTFWRKNRRENADGTFGVDLNRNYGYEWGFNDTGSSPNPGSQTYRGPDAFSEPETEAVRQFCEAHDFQIAQNYHAFGNLLIFPWGFSDELTPDGQTFKLMGEAMTRENNYFDGTASETVGYTVNGTSDDWMYGEQTTKNLIYAMTPEVGPDIYGFWPPASEINQVVKSALLLNLTTAHLVHNYGLATDIDGPVYDQTGTPPINVELRRYGLDPGTLTLSLESLTAGLDIETGPQQYALEQGESVIGSFDTDLNGLPIPGEIRYVITVDNGEWIGRDTVTKLFGESNILLSDPATNLDNWTADNGNNGSWGVSEEVFYTAPSSITDSPGGAYASNTVSDLTSEFIGTEPGMTDLRLSFFARWDIENDYDYVQVEISVEDAAFVPLCGKYTNTGVSSQGQAGGEPLYDGTRLDWVREEIDLSPYLNPNTSEIFRLRFLFFSDNFQEGDGFYFDELEITSNQEVIIPTFEPPVVGEADFLQPNPGSDFVQIALTELQPDWQLQIFDTYGRPVLRQPARGSAQRIDVSGLIPGLYVARLTDASGVPVSRPQRLIIVR